MRPSSTTITASTTATTGVHQWRSPLPYLFGGLAIMLLLITVALFILVCSYRKRSSTSSSSGDEEKPPKPMNGEIIDSGEPKIVVIMAGDDKPTYLATPAVTATTSVCTCGRDIGDQVQYYQSNDLTFPYWSLINMKNFLHLVISLEKNHIWDTINRSLCSPILMVLFFSFLFVPHLIWYYCRERVKYCKSSCARLFRANTDLNC